eukprot:scaffold2117_cov241-Pinguiococcus_pyrenoidosus.AAC.5
MQVLLCASQAWIASDPRLQRVKACGPVRTLRRDVLFEHCERFVLLEDSQKLSQVNAMSPRTKPRITPLAQKTLHGLDARPRLVLDFIQMDEVQSIRRIPGLHVDAKLQHVDGVGDLSDVFCKRGQERVGGDSVFGARQALGQGGHRALFSKQFSKSCLQSLVVLSSCHPPQNQGKAALQSSMLCNGSSVSQQGLRVVREDFQNSLEGPHAHLVHLRIGAVDERFREARLGMC